MNEIKLKKDSEWAEIDGEICRVVEFNPAASFENGKIKNAGINNPYASLELECKKYPNLITGFITHKTDFMHLWIVFKERGVKENEEVIISWSINHFKNYIFKLLSIFMPKLWVMICPKDAYRIINFPDYKPELSGESRYFAKAPIAEWKPDVMK